MSNLLTSAVVAAVVSGAVTIIGIVIAERRKERERKRETFASALAAIVAYAEFPYVIRRRRASDPEGERIRISEELRGVQQDIEYHRAWIATESDSVQLAYDALVKDTRAVAGAEISKAWDVEPITGDAQMQMPDLGLKTLEAAKGAYLQTVKEHLKKRRWS